VGAAGAHPRTPWAREAEVSGVDGARVTPETVNALLAPFVNLQSLKLNLKSNPVASEGQALLRPPALLR